MLLLFDAAVCHATLLAAPMLRVTIPLRRLPPHTRFRRRRLIRRFRRE